MRPSASGSRLSSGPSPPRFQPRTRRRAPRRPIAPPEAALELGAGVHDEMHGRAEPGVGPLAGGAAARCPQRDQPRGAGAAGEQQQHGADTKKQTGHEARGLGQEPRR